MSEQFRTITKTRYPLIILGAGASHDFTSPGVPWERISMPVTNELIQRLDPDIAAKYSEVQPLFSRIAPIVASGRKTLEESLMGINNHSQHSGLRFYLQEYFYKKSNTIEVRQHSINNYKGLIDWINRGKAKGAYIVSFNYDTLFEWQLDISQFVELSDYINKPIKLIKLHGSSDWFSIRRKSTSDEIYGINSAYNYLKQNPEFQDGPLHTERMLNRIGDRIKDFWHIPALALPTPESKPFICPPNHIEALNNAMKDVSKILIIGWSAGDKQLLELIEKGIINSIPVYVVSGSNKGIEKVKDNIKNISNLTIAKEVIGFSGFLADEQICSEFFE